MLKIPNAKSPSRVFRSKIMRELSIWVLIIPAAFAITGIWFFYNSQPASATGTLQKGRIYYGDTTNAGIMRSQTNGWAGEFNGITGNASNILWTVAKMAPTREEIMIGSLRVDGELQIESCTTDCNATADFTNQWANPGTTATQDCDAAPTAGTCVRAFDIAYEPLKGRSMVAYADNTADKFYYALWDNSAWSPDSTPASPSATNEIDFHTGGTGGTPRWIRAVAAGDQNDIYRANRIMVLVADSNDDLFACYWDGSTFSCTASALEASLQSCANAQCIDGAWTSSSRFVLAYYDTAASTLRYQIYTVGTGWGGEQNGPALGSAGLWLFAANDPLSSRILVSTTETGDDVRAIMWRGDDATDGWTTCSATGCPDTAVETASGPQSAGGFYRASSPTVEDALWVFNNAGAGGTATEYSYFTPSSTWANVAASTDTASDDLLNIRAWGVPTRSTDLMLVAREDVDCDLYVAIWRGSGTGWTGITADIEVELSNYGVACPNQGTPAGGAALNYDFAWYAYSPWQRNWRFYSGTDTASTPTTALAAENTAPTGFDRTVGKFRLRINYAERGVSSDANTRKKLQYTSGCNPNVQESQCTWTDVDDAGGSGIWRYDQDADLACTPTDCDDDVNITGSVLSGTSTCTASNGCATWVMDKDAAHTNMDQNSSTTQEAEYIVEANGATGGTTYYFRIFGLPDYVPYYPEQDTNDCGSGNTDQCTYPSLTTDNPVDVQMRHGNRFDSGAKLTFSWAD